MKVRKCLLVLALVLVVALCIAGCDADDENKLYGFALGHYDAADADGALDSDYFYRNDLTVVGGDADVEWVPEERDPVWGGYYYMYCSGNIGEGHLTVYKDGTAHTTAPTTREAAAEVVDHKATIICVRSKDLNDWEPVGAVDGIYACYFQSDSWMWRWNWAPEVIYDENSGKYYLYMNSASYNNYGEVDEETQYGNDSLNTYDTFHVGIYVSDTPAGPFVQVESESYYEGLTYEEMNDAQKATYDATGKLSNLNGKVLTHRNPTINFTYDLGLDEGDNFTVLDLDPFFDDDGTLYLAFARSGSSLKDGSHRENCGWIVRMKDMVTPDLETLTFVNANNFEYVTDENVGSTPKERADESAYTKHNCFAIPVGSSINYGKDIKAKLEAELAANPNAGNKATIEGETGTETWTKGLDGIWIKDGWDNESTINEGQHLWKEGDRYYLTYSPRGFFDMNYDAKQSISDTGILGPYYKLPQKEAVVVGRGWGDYINADMSGTAHHAFVEVDGEMFVIYYVHADPTTVENGAINGRWYAFDRVVTYEHPTYGTLLVSNGPTKNVQYKPSTYTGLTNVASQAIVTATDCEEDTVKYLTDGLVPCYEHLFDKQFVANGKTTITLKFNKAVTISALMVYNTMEYDYAFSSIDSVQFHLAKASDWMDEEHAHLRDCYIKDVGFCTDYIDTELRKISTGSASAISFNEITVDEITITISAKIDGSDDNTAIKISDIVVLGK